MFQGAAGKGLSPREKVRRLSAIWIRRRETTRSGLMLLAFDLHRNSPAQSGRLLADYAARYKQAISRSLGVGPDVSDAVFTYLIGVNLHAVLAPRGFSFRKRIRNIERVLIEALKPSRRQAPERLGALARKRARR
jgi:hypothetical protein